MTDPTISFRKIKKKRIILSFHIATLIQEIPGEKIPDIYEEGFKVKAPNNLVPGGKDNYHLNFYQQSERNHKQRKKEGEGKVGYFVLEKQLNECEL